MTTAREVRRAFLDYFRCEWHEGVGVVAGVSAPDDIRSVSRVPGGGAHRVPTMLTRSIEKFLLGANVKVVLGAIMRRQYLKGYIIALIADKVLKATDPVNVILKKIGIAMREDIKDVLEDLARTVAEQGVRAAGRFAEQTMRVMFDEIANKIGKR